MRQPCHLYSSLSTTIHHREGISCGGKLTNSRRLAMVGFLRWLVRRGSRPGGRSLATTRRSMAPAQQVSGARDPPSAVSAQVACPADAAAGAPEATVVFFPRRSSRPARHLARSGVKGSGPEVAERSASRAASTDQVRLARTACGPRSVPDSCGCGAAGPGWPGHRCSSVRGGPLPDGQVLVQEGADVARR